MPRSDATRLSMLAEEAFAKAIEMTDPTCRRMMFDIAATYDWLAEGAETREYRKPLLGEVNSASAAVAKPAAELGPGVIRRDGERR